MNNLERLEEIKNKFKDSNKYMLTLEYEDIEFLINALDAMQKRALYGDIILKLIKGE